MNIQNVVLIVMDTVRIHDGLSLDPGQPTESAFDQVSAEGTRYTQAFSSAPWTLPSHASLFTGTPPSKHGAHAGHKQLNDGSITLPEVLQKHGYETAAVSNNTWISEEFGFERGFETFYKTWQYVQSDTDLGKIAREEEGISRFSEATKTLFNGNPITNLANAVYGQFIRKSGDDGAARTNEWIENWLTGRDDSRPFFLFVNYLEPHLEYRPPEAHAKEHLPEGVTYEEAMEVSQDAWGYIADTIEITKQEFETLRALYRSEIAYLREKIGEVVDLLKAQGEWEETLFILTSDHGENIGDHGLMDHQYALYDTLLHVPLYVHGGPFETDTIDRPVQLLDIPPTVLETVNIDATEADRQFQGISFHPDAGEAREYAVAEYMAPQPSMEALEKRVDDLPKQVYEYDRSLRAIRSHDWKLIRGSDGSTELYHVAEDPEELTNLVSERPEKVSELGAELNAWLSSFEHADTTENVDMADATKDRLEDLGYLQ
jgi:arylsulfatase A-like enzyme